MLLVVVYFRTPDCVARVKSLTKCCLNDTNLERMPNEIGWLVALLLLLLLLLLILLLLFYSLVNLQVLEARDNILTELHP